MGLSLKLTFLVCIMCVLPCFGALQGCSSGEASPEDPSASADAAAAETPLSQTDIAPNPNEIPAADAVPTNPTPDLQSPPVASEDSTKTPTLASTESTPPPKRSNRKKRAHKVKPENTEAPPIPFAESNISPMPMLEAAPPPQMPQTALPIQMESPPIQKPGVISPAPPQPVQQERPSENTVQKIGDFEMPFSREKLFLVAGGLLVLAGVGFMMRKPA